MDGVQASHISRRGPPFTPGQRPVTLGWGPDTDVYPGKFVVNASDGAEMVWVPPGSFGMGSQTAEIADILGGNRPAGAPDPARIVHDERPYHAVRISRGYWLYRRPVTRGQCRSLLGECPTHRMGWRRMLGHTPPAAEPDWTNDGGDSHPVMWATWNYATDYARQAGVRLPTEGEWEYAARGQQFRRYPWGNEWDASRCQSEVDRHGFEWATGTVPKGWIDESRANS